jgi:hypothetical protein
VNIGSYQHSRAFLDGGAEEIRTPDPHNAIVVLYQLSYDPIQKRRKDYLVEVQSQNHFLVCEVTLA